MLSVILVESSPIKSDEVVVFYPTYAYRDAEDKNWVVMIHGSIYEPEVSSRKRSATVSMMRRLLKLKKGSEESNRFDQRIRLFLVDNERDKKISIRLGRSNYQLSPSGDNGHFFGKILLSDARLQRILSESKSKRGVIAYRAITRKKDRRTFEGQVQLIGNSGVSIISDTDDTIKHTQIANRHEMLANTFLRPFKPVDGMAKLYQHAASRGAVFHYVSGSPWQLYTPLSNFFHTAGFPAGSFHLKHFRLTDSSILKLFASQKDFKHKAIEEILRAFPKRRFVLVGDSGEQDPEIYGQIAGKYGKRIAGILIRNVTRQLANDKRFQRAFEGLAKDRWKLFSEPKEIQQVFSQWIEPQ